MSKAFDIAGINNKLEALAKHLGIDSDSEVELSAIEQRHTSGMVHTYVHEEIMYFVANSAYGLAADKLVEFNSNHWSVLAQKEDSPYERFYDAKVMTQLRSISPDGYKLIGINQKDHKILFRTSDGFLVVFKYAIHIPTDISSYYLLGSATDVMSELCITFAKYYIRQNSDVMLHDTPL